MILTRYRLPLTVPLILALAGVLLPGCGGSPTTPTPPLPPLLTISAITPARGDTTGETEVTITGTGFAAGATVTIGGTAATNVRVPSATTIVALAQPNSAGAADVSVAVGSTQATLPGAFTYVPPPTPPPSLTMAGITPARGATTGETEVTITGAGFATGATVTIGGTAATNVRVSGETTIVALAQPHGAGAADVSVAVGSTQATLPGAFTYVTTPAGATPTVTAISVQGTRPNEPSGFADLGEEVVVTATVTAEVPVDRLTFEWTSDVGTFSGTGPTVRWRAPLTYTTPGDVRLSVKVSRMLELSTSYLPASTVSVVASTTLRLHNSVKEVSELSVRFLTEFSISTIPAETVVRDFWDGCQGKADELADVRNNRALFEITSYRISDPTEVLVNFNGRCAFGNMRADACIAVPCVWKDILKSTGQTGTSTGIDHVTAVYRNSRWWLCDSAWDGTTAYPLWRFIR